LFVSRRRKDGVSRLLFVSRRRKDGVSPLVLSFPASPLQVQRIGCFFKSSLGLPVFRRRSSAFAEASADKSSYGGQAHRLLFVSRKFAGVILIVTGI